MRLLKWKWRYCRSGLAYAGSSPSLGNVAAILDGNNLLDFNGGSFLTQWWKI